MIDLAEFLLARIAEDEADARLAMGRPSRPGSPLLSGRPCDTLLLLALPYAEHPDYREEWRL